MASSTRPIPRVARFRNAISVKVPNRRITCFALNNRFLFRIQDAQRYRTGANLQVVPIGYKVVRGKVSVLEVTFSQEAFHAMRILFQEYEKNKVEPYMPPLPGDN